MSWRLARSLAALADEVEQRWPGTTIWSIGDQDHASRASDHNPNQADVVCAIDVLGREQAAAIWAHLLDRRDPREKYQIHARRIVSATTSPWQVRHYGGSNPHADHIHISVGRGSDGSSYRADLYDDPSPWGLTSNEEDDMVPDGARMRDVQEDLNWIAEHSTYQFGRKLKIDGEWGPKTSGALDAFRQVWGLRTRDERPNPADLTKVDRTIHEIKEHDPTLHGATS